MAQKQLGKRASGSTDAVTLADLLAALLPASTPFATTIPLDGIRYMPRQAVSGPLAFSAGATNPGGTLTVSLISDGTDTPTFSGMVEDSSSQGWLSTQYAVNNLTFWADDTTVYYAIRQAATPQMVIPAATAYTLTGPSTANVGSASTYTAQSNGSLASAVTVTPSDGGAGGTFSPTSVTLAAGNNTSATFTYTPAGAATVSISTTNNGGLTNPAALSVTVTAAAANQNLRFTLLSGLTETTDTSPPLSGSGTAYDYASTGSDYSTGYATSSVGIPANADGYVGASIKLATAGGPMIGLGSTSTNGGNYASTIDYGMFSDGSGSAWKIISAKSPISATTTVVPAAGDVGRVRRSGTTIVAEVSKNAGSTWTTIYTWTGVNTAKLYAHMQAGVSNSLIQPFASTNAA